MSLDKRGAYFIVREHEQVRFTLKASDARPCMRFWMPGLS
jgi:hypothetical protein